MIDDNSNELRDLVSRTCQTQFSACKPGWVFNIKERDRLRPSLETCCKVRV
jgi:hypothetical protein